MCSTRHVDKAKIHLHKGTWSASPSPVHLTGESQSAEAFTRFCRPLIPMIQPGITCCHREVKDYLKVRAVRCVVITAHDWLWTCGTRMWEKWVVNIPLLSVYISWHFLYNSPMCFPPLHFSICPWKSSSDRNVQHPFCCCINQLYTPSLAGKLSPLWPVWRKLNSDLSFLGGEKKTGTPHPCVLILCISLGGMDCLR